MKGRDLDTVARKLRALETPSDHVRWKVPCECGKILAIPFRSRKPPGQDLGDRIEGSIVKQLGVSKELVREIAACHKSRPEFLAAHAAKGHLCDLMPEGSSRHPQ